MERLPTFRTRLVQGFGVLCASLLQIGAGIMCVPYDLAPQGTLLGWLIAQERSWLPWALIGVNAFVMYTILTMYNHLIAISLAVFLSLLHGVSYSIVFYWVNPYPSWDWGGVIFFASLYWALVGGIWLVHQLLRRLFRSDVLQR